MPDEAALQATLDKLIARAGERIAVQQRAEAAGDAKTLGLLATGSVVIVALFTSGGAFAGWWVPYFLLVPGVGLLVLIIWPSSFDVGPDLRAFYDATGGKEHLTASRQMFAQMLAAIEGNDQALPRPLTRAGEIWLRHGPRIMRFVPPKVRREIKPLDAAVAFKVAAVLITAGLIAAAAIASVDALV